MDPVAPLKAPLDLAIKPQSQQEQPSAAAEIAAQRMAEHVAAMRSDIAPDKLQVRLDASAQRFVQIVTDAESAETLLRYPSEAQLAYSRAVMAYLRALSA